MEFTLTIPRFIVGIMMILSLILLGSNYNKEITYKPGFVNLCAWLLFHGAIIWGGFFGSLPE